LLSILERIDAFRRPERLDPILIACEADQRGRLGSADSAYPQADYVRAAHAAAARIDAAAFVREGLAGPAIGEAMRVARRRAIADVRASLIG
jgi:tRNA nucleotidyltransferase (CCA-adding enzyme)